jgi:hypothetical protein
VNPSHRKADLELDGLVSELAADILFNLLHPVTFLLSVGQDNFLQYVPGSHVLMEVSSSLVPESLGVEPLFPSRLTFTD